jgi:hypothetical protein
MRESTITCPSAHCVATHEKYKHDKYVAVGKVYDLDSAPKWAPRAIAMCECCGSYFDGQTWKAICIRCQKEVQPGEKTGLFWPHSCKECNEKQIAEEKARGAVCNTCRNTFSWCYC